MVWDSNLYLSGLEILFSVWQKIKSKASSNAAKIFHRKALRIWAHNSKWGNSQRNNVLRARVSRSKNNRIIREKDHKINTLRLTKDIKWLISVRKNFLKIDRFLQEPQSTFQK